MTKSCSPTYMYSFHLLSRPLRVAHQQWAHSINKQRATVEPGGSEAEGLWLLWPVAVWTQPGTAAHKRHIHLYRAPVPTVRVANRKPHQSLPTGHTAGHTTSQMRPLTCPISAFRTQIKTVTGEETETEMELWYNSGMRRPLAHHHSLKTA